MLCSLFLAEHIYHNLDIDFLHIRFLTRYRNWHVAMLAKRPMTGASLWLPPIIAHAFQNLCHLVEPHGFRITADSLQKFLSLAHDTLLFLYGTAFSTAMQEKLFLSNHLAVVDGEVEEEADELVARASGLVGECIDTVDYIPSHADGQGFMPVLSAFSFCNH